MPIGYFGEHGRMARGVTHVVAHNRTLLCGCKVGSRMVFQWCAEANPDTLKLVECKRCRVKYRELINADLATSA